MSLEAIIAEDKSIMLSVANIGVVHDYQRHAADWKDLLDFFKDPATGQIRGWDIDRESSPAEAEYMNRVSDREHVILIRGFMGLKDSTATGKTFRALVEAVCTKFRPLADLNGILSKGIQAWPLVVTRQEQGMLGPVLAHYVELRQRVKERFVY